MKSFDSAIGVGNKLLDALDQASSLLHQFAKNVDLDSDESDVLDAFNGVYVRVANKVEELQDSAEDKKSDGSELEKDYSAKTGKPLITDDERTALGDLASIIGKKPGDDQLEIF